MPGWSGTQRAVRRFGAQIARRMALFGETLSAEEALSKGLVDQLAKRGQGNRGAEIGKRVGDAGMDVCGHCRAPFLVGPLAMQTQIEIMDDFRATIDVAADIQARSLTIVEGVS